MHNPPLLFDLDLQLEKVICDEDKRNLREPVLSNIDKIMVATEETNKNWLHKLQIWELCLLNAWDVA